MRTVPRPGPAHSRRGMTAIELLVTMTILAVALHMTAAALVNTGRVEPQQRETAIALDAARDISEQMRAADPAQLFALYNDDPADDPDGAGTAPGGDFDVPGLDPQEGDADGLVGRIDFPTVAGELREDVDDRDLGMPRDLNMDGVTDGLDHAGDYQVLPYRLTLEWRSESRAERRLTVFGMTRTP